MVFRQQWQSLAVDGLLSEDLKEMTWLQLMLMNMHQFTPHAHNSRDSHSTGRLMHTQHLQWNEVCCGRQWGFGDALRMRQSDIQCGEMWDRAVSEKDKSSAERPSNFLKYALETSKSSYSGLMFSSTNCSTWSSFCAVLYVSSSPC